MVRSRSCDALLVDEPYNRHRSFYVIQPRNFSNRLILERYSPVCTALATAGGLGSTARWVAEWRDAQEQKSDRAGMAPGGRVPRAAGRAGEPCRVHRAH